jgi:hypothetical protein
MQCKPLFALIKKDGAINRGAQQRKGQKYFASCRTARAQAGNDRRDQQRAFPVRVRNSGDLVPPLIADPQQHPNRWGEQFRAQVEVVHITQAIKVNPSAGHPKSKESHRQPPLFRPRVAGVNRRPQQCCHSAQNRKQQQPCAFVCPPGCPCLEMRADLRFLQDAIYQGQHGVAQEDEPSYRKQSWRKI